MLPLVGWPPHCVFRAVTGVPCPLCGMTTGVLALARGDVLASLAANPAAPLFVLAVAVTVASRLVPRPALAERWRDLGVRARAWRFPILAGMWAFELHRLPVRW